MTEIMKTRVSFFEKRKNETDLSDMQQLYFRLTVEPMVIIHKQDGSFSKKQSLQSLPKNVQEWIEGQKTEWVMQNMKIALQDLCSIDFCAEKQIFDQDDDYTFFITNNVLLELEQAHYFVRKEDIENDQNWVERNKELISECFDQEKTTSLLGEWVYKASGVPRRFESTGLSYILCFRTKNLDLLYLKKLKTE